LKKDELPDICLATKYPINYIEELQKIPDLYQLAEDLLDKQLDNH